MFPDTCLYLSKNKQTEVVHENSEDLNKKIDILGTRQERLAIVLGYRRDIAPSISGSTMSEIGNRVFQNYYTKPNKEK